MNTLKDFQQLKKLKILVIGDYCTDIYHYGVCERISPEAPVPVFKHLKTYKVPGMSGNVYNNLSAFSHLVSVEIIRDKSEIKKTRFIDSTSGQHLLRADFGEEKQSSSLEVNEEVVKSIKNATVIIISDYNKGFITPKVARKVTKICKNFNKLVLVDTKKTNIGCFKNSFIKLNQLEYSNIISSSKRGDQKFIITLGKQGAKFKNKIYETTPVEVADVSGAGDTFLAAFAVYYGLTQEVDFSISKATMFSSFVVQKSGTYSLKSEDVFKLLGGE